MTKLSKREKTLLYVLSITVIVAAMVMLVIQPALSRRNDLSDQLEAQQMQLAAMEQTILTQANAQDRIAEYDQDIQMEKAFYLPAMTSDDLDKYVTGMLQQHGLIAQSLLITEVSASDVTSADGTNEASKAVGAEGSGVHTYQVDVTAAGTINQFVDLTEAVGETDGIRIGAFALKPLVTPKPTPSPKPTKTPRSARTPRPTRTPRGMTPTPVAPTPAPTPANPSYAASVTFYVLEYGEIAGVTGGALAPTATPAPTLEVAK